MIVLRVEIYNQIGSGKVSPVIDIEAIQQLIHSLQPEQRAVQNVTSQLRGVEGLADMLTAITRPSFKNYPLLGR